MEILIFALIASYNGHRRQERVVAEPEEFKPFDLQALRNSGNTPNGRASGIGSSCASREHRCHGEWATAACSAKASVPSRLNKG